ncbi:MAG TPA: hypothetical protein DDZ62_09760, partial [Delftia acidovorans]|nr:hypothetical protein [Delftia acidovorans]
TATLAQRGRPQPCLAPAQPLHQRFAAQAHLHLARPALAFGPYSLSYAELNARANRLAHCLIALGVRPETRVGIAMSRSVEMV